MRSASILVAMATAFSLISVPVSAQNETVSDITKQAMAAGYKALFTCSGTFVANQQLAVIDANELDGIYTDYRPLMAGLSDANIDERNRRVTVRYDRALPPRIAQWRTGMGCSLLPIGATPAAAEYLPRFSKARAERQADQSSVIGDGITVTSIDNPLAFGKLEVPVSFAFDGTTYGEGTRTSAVVVARDGRVLAENYARGMSAEKPQRTWSVAKSLTSTILGAAVQDGLVGLDNTAILKAWNEGGDPRRDITLRHVLDMASGLESGTRGSRTDRLYFGGAATDEVLQGRVLEAKPGKRFKYSNYDTLAAMLYLREALDDDDTYLAYPYQAVLNKIGALNTTLETDWKGDFVSSSQVWMTARDMARLGQLYLQNGMWGGEQIINPEWIEYVTTPAEAQPENNPFGYAGAFWLLGGAEGLPADTFAGLGNRGQYLVIVPSRDLVIVRRGYDVAGLDRFDIARFAADIFAAIDAADAEKAAEEAAAAAAEVEAEEAALEDEARREERREAVRSRVGRRE
ncbi:MAG: serine hydrolase [Pseudomonadota bacterium]